MQQIGIIQIPKFSKINNEYKILVNEALYLTNGSILLKTTDYGKSWDSLFRNTNDYSLYLLEKLNNDVILVNYKSIYYYNSKNNTINNINNFLCLLIIFYIALLTQQ